MNTNKVSWFKKWLLGHQDYYQFCNEPKIYPGDKVTKKTMIEFGECDSGMMDNVIGGGDYVVTVCGWNGVYAKDEFGKEVFINFPEKLKDNQ